MTAVTKLGNLSLARIDLDEAVAWIVERAREERACVVVTSNIHHLRLAEEDAEFAAVLARAELNVADGWPVVAATKLTGQRVPERVAGIDLVDAVLSQEEVRLRLAILGGPPGAATRLAERVSPRHDVVYVDELPPGQWDGAGGLDRLAAALAAVRPTLTLIGIGAPRQELLADALRPALAGPAIGCGAAVEVLAGIRPRAPKAVQAVRLEWAFRAALEPRRLLPRYARAGWALLGVLARELRRRSR